VAAIVVLCLGGLAVAMTQTLVVPIQSDLPALLDTTGASAGWVITVTLLAGAVGMPLSGRLADMFGKQRVFVINVAILMLASIVCALAESLLPMLVGRGLQGVSMGMIPVGISLLREITPPHLAATAIAAMSGTMGVGGAIALPMSAAISAYADWHYIFWVAAAVAALVLILTLVYVPAVDDAQGGRVDVLGAVGMAVGLVGVLVGISKGSDWGWADARTLTSILLGLGVLAVWTVWELRVIDPLVDLRTTVRRPVLMTNLAAIAVGFGLMANLVTFPQLMQLDAATGHGVGVSLMATGLWLAPAGLMMMLFAPVSGRLIDRYGARVALLVGAGVLAGGYLLAMVLNDAAWQLSVAACVIAAGVGIAYAAMPTLIMDAVPMREAGAAVGLNALMRAIGTTTAAAVMATVLTTWTSSHDGANVATEGAYLLCFGLGALLALTGMLLAASVPHCGTPTRPPAEVVRPLSPGS
jgi:MFS family permease